MLSVLAVGFYGLLALGSTDEGTTTGGASRGSAPQPKTIEYRVEGEHFDVTINNAQGNTEQLSGLSGPWARSFQVSSSRYFAYISAQNQESYGTIVVEIYVDGTKVESARSSGEYVIAQASTAVR